MEDDRVEKCYILLYDSFYDNILIRIITFYRVIHNPLTHFTKSVHCNGGKDCNMRPTDGKRNSASILCLPHKCSMCPPFVT
jgi:hypothetical protein